MPEPRGPSPQRGCLRACLAVLLFALLVGLLARAFVGDLYRISSVSMEPCLRHGEWVLVRYDRSPPERWELVVLSLPGEEDAIVKRVVGLPRERVQIADGDLLIDGFRPPLSNARPAPVPLQRCDWRAEPTPHARWTIDGCRLAVDALAAAPGEPGALALLGGRALDDVPEAPGASRPGESEVADLVLEVRFTIEETREGAELVVGLSEQGDAFWLVVETAPGSGGRQARLARLRRSKVEELGAVEEIAWAPLDFDLVEGDPTLELANVDNHLRGRVRGTLVFDIPYESNRFAADDASFEGTSPGPRAFLGVAHAKAELVPALARDLHYIARGRFAVTEPLQLGPADLFVLGDDSSHSRDGREWGPVRLEHLVGRPIFVVWPPSRWGVPGVSRPRGPGSGVGGSD